MKIPARLIILVLCAIPLSAQQSSPDHAAMAAEFVRHGDLKKAEKELGRALELTPDDPALLTSLGGVLGIEGQIQQANVFLAKAVKLQPQDALLRRNLAANEWQLGRFPQAQADLEQILSANPADKAAIFLLGMVSENERDYPRCIALLESVPEIAERQPEAFVALASSYYHTGRRERARSALKQLLSASANSQAMLMAARVSTDAHDYPLTLQLATEATSRFPENYQLFLIKASAEIKLNYFSHAVSSAQRAVDLHPSPETRRELAFAEWHAGNKNDAISGFDELLRRNPRDVETLEAYGGLLLEDGTPESKGRAVQLLKRALALDNSSYESRYQLGNVELSDGELDAARRDLAQAIALNRSDSRAHFAMSRVYRRLGLDAEADRELEQYRKVKDSRN